jgi:hypothetical protein
MQVKTCMSSAGICLRVTGDPFLPVRIDGSNVKLPPKRNAERPVAVWRQGRDLRAVAAFSPLGQRDT